MSFRVVHHEFYDHHDATSTVELRMKFKEIVYLSKYSVYLEIYSALEFQSNGSTFVTETRQICSRTNKFIIMSAAIGLASSCLAQARISGFGKVPDDWQNRSS
jgi:hypothetical protein